MKMEDLDQDENFKEIIANLNKSLNKSKKIRVCKFSPHSRVNRYLYNQSIHILKF